MVKYLIPLVFLLAACGTSRASQSGFDIPYGDFWEKTDFTQTSVDVKEIRSGGPPPDGIPPIDNPRYEAIEVASNWLQPQSPVIAVEINGDARAYPLAILTRHEIANTEIGGVPVAVTFCPLCNSGIVFDRRLQDGSVIRLGVSGLLRNSDMVMWDDLTQSWWQQFTGEAIVGALTGTELNIFTSQMIGFGAFVERYPEGQVLSREGAGYGSGSYGRNPYNNYDSSSRPFLYRGELDERLNATERVLGGEINGEAVAYSFTTLQQFQVINDTVGDRGVVAFWQPGAASALDDSNIDRSRDVGMAMLYRRELDGQVLDFVMVDDEIRDTQTDSTWNVFGQGVAGEFEGSQLRQELAAPHFWFAWYAFFPETRLYEP